MSSLAFLWDGSVLIKRRLLAYFYHSTRPFFQHIPVQCGTAVLPLLYLRFPVSNLVVIWSGCDLCEVGAAVHCPGPAAGGAELPHHRHTPGYEPGGEAQQVRLILRHFIAYL